MPTVCNPLVATADGASGTVRAGIIAVNRNGDAARASCLPLPKKVSEKSGPGCVLPLTARNYRLETP
jgi:hypothetical protein